MSDFTEIKNRLGVCRNTKGGREYYDCPKCTVKNPVGFLVVDWAADKFICNHVDSCGFAGTISKSLGFELGIKKHTNTHTEYKKPIAKAVAPIKYDVGKIEPEKIIRTNPDQNYDSKQDLEAQLKALFGNEADLITCIDSNYGKLIKTSLNGLKNDSSNHTHFKVNLGGTKADDIKEYKYTLVECDSIADLKIQQAFFNRLNLPITSLTWSGNKSLHAIVKVDAGNDFDEYKRRVELIHEVCDSVGFKIDKTKDCCRFTRLAGSLNNKTNKIQRLVGLNLGCKSWNEWEFKHLPSLVKIDGVHNISSVKMQSVEAGFSSGFATYDYNNSGCKNGELVLLIGKRNQGKTTCSRQIIIASALQGVKSFVWYGENSLNQEKGYLVRLVARKDEIVTEDNGFGRTTWRADKKAEARFDEHFSPYIDMYEKPSGLKTFVFDDLINKMNLKAQQGTKLFVIDNMMKLTADQHDPFKAQKKIINDLKEFAVKTGSHIILIAHPKKGEGDQSVSGALEQENTADTILRFKRISDPSVLKFPKEFEDAEKSKITALVTIEKVRDGGTYNTMYMEFCNTKQANTEITYLDDVIERVDKYEGMYSRAPQACENRGGVNVNNVYNAPTPDFEDDDF